MDEPATVIHVMKTGGMVSACGLPRVKVFAAHIDRDMISCPHCREKPEFRGLQPVVSAFVIEPHKPQRPLSKPGKRRGAFIRYK